MADMALTRLGCDDGLLMPGKMSRVVYVTGEFDESLTQRVVQDLLRLEWDKPLSPILMVIDSYGGYVDSFMAIHDVMRILTCEVATLCIGKAMSAGQMLLMSGESGMRYVTPNASIMMHQLSSAAWGPLRDVVNEVEEAKRIQSVMDKMILKYTKITKAKLAKIMTKDAYMNACTALELGVVDHIISSTRELRDVGIDLSTGE